MELTHSARLDVPVDRAWEVLGDVELLAACLPGADLDERDGETCRGTLAVRIGPLSVRYAGTVTTTRRDPDARRVVVEVDAAEVDGVGAVQGTLDVTLSPAGARTRASVVATVTASGRAAQFGQSVLADVGDRLLAGLVAQLHATALADDVARNRPAEPAVVAPTPEPGRARRRRRKERPADVPVSADLPADRDDGLDFEPPEEEVDEQPAPSWTGNAEEDDDDLGRPLHLSWSRAGDDAERADREGSGRDDEAGDARGPEEAAEPGATPEPAPEAPSAAAADSAPTPAHRTAERVGPAPADGRLVWKPGPAPGRAFPAPSPRPPAPPRPVVAARVAGPVPPAAEPSPTPPPDRPPEPAPADARPSSSGPVPREVAPVPDDADAAPVADGADAAPVADDADAAPVPDGGDAAPVAGAVDRPVDEGLGEPGRATVGAEPVGSEPVSEAPPEAAVPAASEEDSAPVAPERDGPAEERPAPGGRQPADVAPDREDRPRPAPVDVVGAPASWSEVGVAQRAVPVALVLAILWVLRRLLGSSRR